MAIRINEESMILEIDNTPWQPLGSASTPQPTATARGSCRLTPPGCSAATRRSRP